MSSLVKRFCKSRILICRAKSTTVLTNLTQDDVDYAKEYSELPGPKSLPLLGNNWRFMSYIGEFIVITLILKIIRMFFFFCVII